MINNKINIILVFISVLLFSSCDDSSNRLSGGYTFASSGPLSILPYPTMFDKGINATITDFKSDANFILIEQTPDLKYSISIVAFSLRSNYMTLATIDSANPELRPGQYEFLKEKLIEDSSLYKMLSTRISTENTAQDIEVSQVIADSIIKNDPYYQDIFSREINYWIIVHKEKQKYFYLPSSEILGPYSKEKYLKKRKELGVPENLKLDFEQKISSLETARWVPQE